MTLQKTIVCVGILGIPEKSELLLIVAAKLLQKHDFQTKSCSARA
jgi:hypothetical protein